MQRKSAKEKGKSLVSVELPITAVSGDKLFNRYNFSLIFLGLVLNIALAQFALWLDIPLYLDSIGTIIVAVFGGTVPGIFVGFLSNLLNSIGDPITRYYGLLSALIAVAASRFSKKGAFRVWWGYLVALAVFTFIGGALGSVLTWLLYGLNVGEGISAPFVLTLVDNGFKPFWAQFTADCLIDLADKAVSIVPLIFCVVFFPQKLVGKLPRGYMFRKELAVDEIIARFKAERRSRYKNRSLRSRLVSLTLITGLIIAAISLTIGSTVYQQKIQVRYAELCTAASIMASNEVDAQSVEFYITNPTSAEYLQTEANLQAIYDSFEDIEYLYVYDIREDGCHVVFDLDTPEMLGGEAGDVVEFDESFEPYLQSLLAGESIEPIVSDDQFGWLMSAYTPIVNDENVTVAYACCDFDMQDLRYDMLEFIIQMISLVFGCFILIIAFVLWYADRHIASPIHALVVQAEQFDYEEEPKRIEQRNKIKEPAIFQTGDELEVLHNAMVKTETEIAGYITQVHNQKNQIVQMQQNIIYSFATMVENRDNNTGGHIRRTAEYVTAIAEKLREKPKYAEIITNDYLVMLTQSAPLHDIGKITISDLILNKAGKLTDEEYEKMKTHTTAGREIIASALLGIEDGGYLAMASELAAYHHERYDGKGYPEKISGEQIPLCARIMAVADVFDALVSKRSYKEAFTFEKAVDIIKEGSGSQFDPDIVDAFLACEEVILKIKELVE